MMFIDDALLRARARASAFLWCLVFAAYSVGMIPSAECCNVPVFRYALERWPADPHVVSFSTNAAAKTSQLQPETDANIWCELSQDGQTPDVRVVYPGIDEEWYRGDYDSGILTRLCDSPLRRTVAHELLTGTAAAFVVLETSNAATNEAVYRLVKSRLDAIKDEIDLPEVLDYSGGGEAYGPPSGGESGPIPVQLEFSLHRVSRTSAEEAFLVRQLVALDEGLADATKPAVFAIFGRARCIPLFDDTLTGGTIEELCMFLCGACSCSVKAMNPGVDLLFSVNWEDAVFDYPESVSCTLPNGSTYRIGGTQQVSYVEVGGMRRENGVAAEERTGKRPRVLWVSMIGLGLVVLGAIALIVGRKR